MGSATNLWEQVRCAIPEGPGSWFPPTASRIARRRRAGRGEQDKFSSWSEQQAILKQPRGNELPYLYKEDLSGFYLDKNCRTKRKTLGHRLLDPRAQLRA